MENIAKMVVESTNGKEVRGAIAKGFRLYDGVTGEVFERVSKIEEENEQLRLKVSELKHENEMLKSDKVDNSEFNNKLSEFNEDWKDRLRRVTLGTDSETLNEVVDKILKAKGVI